jgi:hypothetical protein
MHRLRQSRLFPGHDDIVPTVGVAADAGTALPCPSGRATLEA